MGSSPKKILVTIIFLTATQLYVACYRYNHGTFEFVVANDQIQNNGCRCWLKVFRNTYRSLAPV